MAQNISMLYVHLNRVFFKISLFEREQEEEQRSRGGETGDSTLSTVPDVELNPRTPRL